MTDLIYLDNSATTPLCREAAEALIAASAAGSGIFGNPSSRHSAGVAAHRALEDARTAVLRSLYAPAVPRTLKGSILFTGSGTEANNLAITGSVAAKTRNAGGRIFITAGEHSSVEETAAALEKQGFSVTRIPTEKGVLDQAFLENELAKPGAPIICASFMLVNNETGAAYDIPRAFAAIRRRYPDAVLHCDAVQGYMKLPLLPILAASDMVSVSAHKIRGPKGIGALWISPDVIKRRALSPVIFGGGQESGFRSGTENVPGIMAFAAAATAGAEHFSAHTAHMSALREKIMERLSGNDSLRMNIPAGNCSPSILNITLPNIKSEVMLNYLSGKGICISSGSACSSHSRKVSRALTAFGIAEKEADTSIRVSVGVDNTVDDADAFADALLEGIGTLARIG